MLVWSNGTSHSRNLFQVIVCLFRNHPKLLEFLFDKECPRLRRSCRDLKAEATRFSTSEELLVRVALDLWQEGPGYDFGDACIWELLTLEGDDFEAVLSSLQLLKEKYHTGAGLSCRQLKINTPNQGWSPIKN